MYYWLLMYTVMVVKQCSVNALWSHFSRALLCCATWQLTVLESSVTVCSNNNNYYYFELIFVDCTEGDLRLIPNGPYKSIGRIELCINGTWGTICSDFIDDNDAMVLCRQLGYSALGNKELSLCVCV